MSDKQMIGKIEYAPDYQSRQTVVPVVDLESMEAKIRRLERELAAEKARGDRLEKALRESKTALDDWINTYASEFCCKTHVAEARTRIKEGGGTLSYIAHIQMRNRAALAQTEEK